MLISDNYIYIAVSKVASQAIASELKKHPYTFSHDQFAGERFPFPGFEEYKTSHVSISMMQPHVDLSSRFKFGFVRNPFDRFVSFCAWSPLQFVSTKGTLTWKEDPYKYMDSMCRKIEQASKYTTMAWSCSKFLTIDDEVAVDFVGRYENLQDDVDKAFEQIGIPKVQLPVKNKGSHADYKTYYNTKLVDRVADIYKRDIELFGYTFE